MPLRFKFSSLISTIDCELHFTPLNLCKQGCATNPFQTIPSTFCGSTALMKLKKDSDSDNWPPIQTVIKRGRTVMHTSLFKNRSRSLLLSIFVVINIMLDHQNWMNYASGNFFFVLKRNLKSDTQESCYMIAPLIVLVHQMRTSFSIGSNVLMTNFFSMWHNQCNTVIS